MSLPLRLTSAELASTGLENLPHIAAGVPRDLLVRALAATSEISLITDAGQNILHASNSFTAITGYAAEEVVGSNCRILQGPGTAPETVRAIRDALARGEKFQGDILNYRKDGSPFWNALKITPLLDESGNVTHFVSVQRDINARMALLEQLRFQSTHDPLTGLPNRAALDDHLAKVLDPDGGPRPAVAVGLIDLVGFKQLNNAFGHEAGDAVLADWAARIQACLEGGECLARMGGDEFVIVIEDVPEREATERLTAVMHRLIRSVESPFKTAGSDIPVAMSAGLALSPRDGSDIRSLLRSADAALNIAKARHANSQDWWHLPTGPSELASAENAADTASGPVADEGTSSTSEVAAAGTGSAAMYTERLFGGGLEMFMQPAVDLREGGVYLFESLARLRLEDGSYLPPAAFLSRLNPAEVDLLFRLGLDQALGWLAEWESQGLSTKVSVNISPSTLLDPDCARLIEDALRRHAISPQRLVLELLETETLNSDRLADPLNRLIELGVGLAMDDLGAGYSSLKRLSTLPFTTVKIDRDMLTGLRSNYLETLSLIATLIQIGRDFDLTVVAEGLEDRAMTEAVAVLGAQYGQGYHLARPMPAEEVPRWTTEFTAGHTAPRLRTALGALAFHWKFLRLGSPHPNTVQDCPFTAYLEECGAERGDVDRWHAQQHQAAGSSGGSRMIIDWLIREIHAGPGIADAAITDPGIPQIPQLPTL